MAEMLLSPSVVFAILIGFAGLVTFGVLARLLGGKEKNKSNAAETSKTQQSDMFTIEDEDLSIELKGSPELLTEDHDGSPDDRCPSATEGSVKETAALKIVEDTQSVNYSKPGSVTFSDDVIPQPCSAQKSDEPDFYDLTPSDVGLQGILSIAPLWYELAVSLGVPFMTIKANSSTPLGGMMCLSKWRNGQSGEGFPNTWRFLLKIIKESGTFGPFVAETIEEKASSERSWSVCPTSQPGPTKHEYTSELCMRYKRYLGAHYEQMKTVEDTWLIRNNKRLTYIQLRLLEAEEELDIKESSPIALGSHDTYSTPTRESNRYVPISTRDILSFNPSEQERKIILLEGTPGSGKSTTARYLCKEYAAGRIFHEYELLIIVYLRLLPRTGCTSFSDLLIPRPGYLQPPDVQKLFEEFSEGRGILLLLEGWDERPQNCSFLDSIIKGDELPASSVIITSRHAAAESLYQKVNRRIEIAPFSIEQKREFVNSYFHNEKNKSSLLIELLSQRPDLSDLCMYPMVLSMACFVYQTDGSLPSTMTEMYINFLILASNRYLKERVNVTDRVSSIEDILNSPHFEDFRNMAKLALEGVRKNQFVFSDDDLLRLGIKLPTSGYNLLLSCSQLDSMGVERGSHHYLHSSVQSCLAALELNLLDKEEQIKVLQECAPEISKKLYPRLWQQYLDQLLENPFKQRRKDVFDCSLSDAEDATKDQRLLLYQFFAGITHLTDEDISSQLIPILLKENAALHKSTLPIILYESRNEELTREITAKTFSTHLTLPRCDNYLLLCTGWCMAQTKMKIEKLTVNLSPDVQLHHFFNYYSHPCYLVFLALQGSIAISDLSSVASVLERCPKLRKLYLEFSIVDSNGSGEGTLSIAERITTLVTDLPDLFKLTIGRHDAPLTDQFTAQVLALIAKSTTKVLQVSSSPVLLQEALLSSNKMESLHTLELLHGTRQGDDNVVFNDEKWRHMEDTLKATKWKVTKLFIASFSSTIFGNQFMSHITQAVYQRRHKEFMSIAYDTIPPGSQEVNNAIDICTCHPASSTALHCRVGDASHLEWMKPLGECLIRFGPMFTIDVYCLISCYGSQLRCYVSSVHAMKHLPGLLILAMDKGIQTMSLSMEREDLLDMSFLPAFSSCTICKEKIDIYRFLTFDGIMLLGDSRMKHYWNEDDECFEMCRLHWILQNKVPRTMDIWMVHVPSTCQ